MIVYIGIDDTDGKNKEKGTKQGTGRIAREVAKILHEKHNIHVIAVTRHQLAKLPDFSLSSNNSAKCVIVEVKSETSINEISAIVISTIKKLRALDSDTGIALLKEHASKEAIALALKAKQAKIEKSEVYKIAKQDEIQLFEIGGSGQGVVGAFAAAVLASTGNDGRYLEIGKIRDLKGTMRVIDILTDKGIDEIKAVDGSTVRAYDLILADKVRPKRENFKAVLYVKKRDDTLWEPVKVY